MKKKQIKNPFFLIFLCIDYNELLYKCRTPRGHGGPKLLNSKKIETMERLI
jgi:hypothetical protein